jgi:hypothetical protein
MNKKLAIIFSILLLSLIATAFQYVEVLKSEIVKAYSANKPANGHSWTEMECTEGLCVTNNNKVGIGTDNPNKKLTVVGDIGASGDICNGTGNCLSALATLTNACGGAATSYVYSASAFSGSYCVMGTPTPATPTWPTAGNSVTWTCPVTSGSPISCTATHAAAPVNGVCGPAATSYTYSATFPSGAYCTTGTSSPTTPSNPSVGSSSSWSCLGTNGGSSPSCTASRANPLPLVNSAHNEADCVAAGGTVVVSDVGYNQCRFNAHTCPSGWTRYKDYTTYSSGSCSGYCCHPTQGCGTGYCTGGTPIAWGNNTTPPPTPYTCAFVYVNDDHGCSGTCSWTLESTVAQIGCY